MPFLDFTAGQVLTADQVDTFLMRQTVMVFDDAAARTTALSGILVEGMVTYLKSTKGMEKFNGSDFIPVGTDPSVVNGEPGQNAISAGSAGLAYENSISPLMLIGA